MSRLDPRPSAGLRSARLVVGGIWLVAGFDKVQSPGAFADAIRAFHLLPPAMVLPVAYALPWLEILVAAYLVVGFLCRAAAAGSMVLLIVSEPPALKSSHRVRGSRRLASRAQIRNPPCIGVRSRMACSRLLDTRTACPCVLPYEHGISSGTRGKIRGSHTLWTQISGVRPMASTAMRIIRYSHHTPF